METNALGSSPYQLGIAGLQPLEPVVIDAEVLEEAEALQREITGEVEEFEHIVGPQLGKPGFISEMSRIVRDRAEGNSIDREEEEEANRAANSLFRICSLMQRLNVLLTELGISTSEMHYQMNETHEKVYRAQQSAHERKAWFALGGGVLGGVATAASTAFGDVGKGIMEAVGKALPSVGKFFETQEDGYIQGGGAHVVQHTNQIMEEDRKQKNDGDQTTLRVWQSLEGILRDLAQTGEASAR